MKTKQDMSTLVMKEKEKQPIVSFRKILCFSKKEKKYDPEFVKKIEQSRKELKEGKGKVIAIADLWK